MRWNVGVLVSCLWEYNLKQCLGKRVGNMDYKILMLTISGGVWNSSLITRYKVFMEHKGWNQTCFCSTRVHLRWKSERLLSDGLKKGLLSSPLSVILSLPIDLFYLSRIHVFCISQILSFMGFSLVGSHCVFWTQGCSDRQAPHDPESETVWDTKIFSLLILTTT